jgi:hypothetical protein
MTVFRKGGAGSSDKIMCRRRQENMNEDLKKILHYVYPNIWDVGNVVTGV